MTGSRTSLLRLCASRCALAGVLLFALGVLAPNASAQFQTRWVSAGALHNWYSSAGAECEVCLVNVQQYGWRWPGLNPYADMQASKGLWIGAQNVADPDGGDPYPVRVVHVGPRVRGVGEVFPQLFELVTRTALPAVTVDGSETVAPAPMHPDRVDASIPSDVVLVTRVNTLLGLTMERRVYQFSQPYHDDYHIIEYVLTNTGNTDADADVELPNQTLEGVTLFTMDQLAVTRESRYVVANSTGWGKNTMNDARGDGLGASQPQPDPADEQFRAQFAWHGYSPQSSLPYDNLGASAQSPVINIAPSDTLGRLTASQFAGVVTLHADASTSDATDDPGQPSTTTWFNSDSPLLSNNDASNQANMAAEYALMTSGHKARHATTVEPTGMPGFLAPSRDPSMGTAGGFSFGNGYGPYTLAPGESVRIVVAEAAGGLSREANGAIGAAFKASGNDADAGLTYAGETMTKNEWIFTSRDSLFQTFRRAIANYDSDFSIPSAPAPPSAFAVVGEAGQVQLTWAPPASTAALAGFEIYRAQGRYDSTYTLIHSAGPGETSFTDEDVEADANYYYHVVSVGREADNDGAGLTPSGALRSSLYATQTYDPVRVLPVATEAGPDAAALRVSQPSPHPVRDQARVSLELGSPSVVTATVYSVTGREVARVLSARPLAAGPHEVAWDASGVAPGVYVLQVRTATESQSVRLVVAR